MTVRREEKIINLRPRGPGPGLTVGQMESKQMGRKMGEGRKIWWNFVLKKPY